MGRRRRRGQWGWEDRRASIAGVTYPNDVAIAQYKSSLTAYDALNKDVRELIAEHGMIVVKIYDSGHRDAKTIKMIMRSKGYNV